MLIWVNTSFCCGGVIVNEQGIIVDCMPILNRFKGQSFKDLVGWLKRNKTLIKYRVCKENAG